MSQNKQGSALLTALFIMTLVAIVATAMSTRLQLDIYRTRLLIAHDKLYLASQAVLFWAFDELNNNKNLFTSAREDSLVDEYPLKAKTIYPGVLISGGLYDLQGSVNLNNFTDKKVLKLLTNLLSQAYPKSTDNENVIIAFALQDWLSFYDLSRGKDSYMSYYLAQKPAYLPSHQPMKSPSELRLLKDISAPLFESLQAYTTALPEATAININTATKPVLMSLGDGLSEPQVEELLALKGTKGIQKTQDLDPILEQFNIPSNQITIQSTYFLAKAQVQSDVLNLVVFFVLKREQDKKGNVNLTVIRESLNAL